MNNLLKQVISIFVALLLSGESLAIPRAGEPTSKAFCFDSQALAVEALSSSRPHMSISNLLQTFRRLRPADGWSPALAWLGTVGSAATLLVAGFSIPPNEMDPIFKSLADGETEFHGLQHLDRIYHVRISAEASGGHERWFRLDLYQATDPQKASIGHILVLYDPDWPTLTIGQTQIDPDFQSDGLRRQIMTHLIKQAKPLTSLRLDLAHSDTIEPLFALYNQNPSLWKQNQGELTKVLTEKLKTDRHHRASTSSALDSALQMAFAQSRLADALQEAGIDILHNIHLFVDHNNLFLETVIGVDQFMQAQQEKTPFAPSALSVRGSLHAFINAFTSRLQVSPPPAVIETAYGALSESRVEVNELFGFLKQQETKLSKLKTAEDVQDLRHTAAYHQLELIEFLENHNLMKIMLTEAKDLPMENTPALAWALRRKVFDSAAIKLIEQISPFTEAALLGETSLSPWPLLRSLYCVLPREDRWQFISILLSFENAIRLGNAPHPMDFKWIETLYSNLKIDWTAKSELVMSGPQSLWARELVTYHGFGTWELLDAMDRIRNMQHLKQASKQAGVKTQIAGRALHDFMRLWAADRKNPIVWELIREELAVPHEETIRRDPRTFYRLLGLFIGKGLFVGSDALQLSLYFLTRETALYESGPTYFADMTFGQFKTFVTNRAGNSLTLADWNILQWSFHYLTKLVGISRSPAIGTSA